MKARRLLFAAQFAITLALALAVCSCRPGKDTASDGAGASVVAQVGAAQLDQQSFRERLARRWPQFTAAQREAALEEWIRQEATYAKACASGFDRQPEQQARIKQLIVNRYLETHLPATDGTDVSAEDVKRVYEAGGDAYLSAATVRGGVIFLAASPKMSAERREQVRAKAESIMAEAKAGEKSFADLARLYSEDQATRYRGGDLGWLKRSEGSGKGPDAQLSEALFTLSRPGDLAPVLETPSGFQVVKLLERKPAARRPLAEVQEAIRYRLVQERKQERERQFHASVKAGLDIRINRPLLESISMPEKVVEPPSISEAAPAISAAQITSDSP